MINRDYISNQATLSFCNNCKKLVQSSIIIKDGKVYVQKQCPDCNITESLLEENASYYLNRKNFDKPSTASTVQTKLDKGCPYDCGLCPQHEQHTCIGLIEITNKCNLNCPFCYASSGHGEFLSLEKIEEMMDFYIVSEKNQAEILQISGGEPTLHPQIFEILKLAKSKNFKYVMLNTNGLKIAQDSDFAKRISEIFNEGKFEVYLQFDGFKSETYKIMRNNKNLFQVKQQAIKNLQRYKIAITLVSTIQKGVNDDEIGAVLDYAINTKYVRGVNLQPVGFFGRLPEEQNPNDRITLTGVLEKIEEQTQNDIRLEDFIPLPCNVERVSVLFLFKDKKGKFIPITRKIDLKKYLPEISNSFSFRAEDILKKDKKQLNKEQEQKEDKNNHSLSIGCDCLNFAKDLKPIIPASFLFKTKKQKIEYIDNNTFRISVTSFVDKYNFDLQSMKKECVHVITPDLKRIPFSAYNMIHYKKYR